MTELLPLCKLVARTAILVAIGMIVAAGSLASPSAAAGQDESKDELAAPKEEDEKTIKDNSAVEKTDDVSLADVSYIIGVNVGREMSRMDVDLDLETFNKGLQNALDGADLEFTDEQMGELLEAFGRMQMRKIAEEKLAFLETNKKKEGVKTTDSGLQYRVIKAGDDTGKQPKSTDSVTVHYKGRFINGEVFDSSIARGEPANFKANQVIKGWTEALQLMHEGDKWELVIPADLAYGRGGQGPIGPDEVLIFEVELIKVND